MSESKTGAQILGAALVSEAAPGRYKLQINDLNDLKDAVGRLHKLLQDPEPKHGEIPPGHSPQKPAHMTLLGAILLQNLLQAISEYYVRSQQPPLNTVETSERGEVAAGHRADTLTLEAACAGALGMEDLWKICRLAIKDWLMDDDELNASPQHMLWILAKLQQKNIQFPGRGSYAQEVARGSDEGSGKCR